MKNTVEITLQVIKVAVQYVATLESSRILPRKVSLVYSTGTINTGAVVAEHFRYPTL